MIEDKKLIKYKKSFFTKIKEGLLNFFHRKQIIQKRDTIKDNNNEQKEEKTVIEDTLKEPQENILKNKNMSKEEFMEIYNKVKNKEIDTDTLDEDTLYKIMIMLNEEIELSSKKVYNEIRKTEELITDYNNQNNN